MGVWSITMVATHLPKKACDAHVTSFTRPSSRLTISFFPASKIVSAEESEREDLGTRRPGNEATNLNQCPLKCPCTNIGAFI